MVVGAVAEGIIGGNSTGAGGISGAGTTFGGTPLVSFAFFPPFALDLAGFLGAFLPAVVGAGAELRGSLHKSNIPAPGVGGG